jgi:hypothetical protein
VSVQPQIAAARDDVRRARDQISGTIVEIEERITAPAKALTRTLDVGRAVQDHPWAALALAVGAGFAVATTGADGRAAEAAAEAARQGADRAKQGGTAGLRLVREVPVRSRGAVSSAVDALGAKLVLALVDALRGPRVTPMASEPHTGLGFLNNPAPAHEAASGAGTGAGLLPAV